jgi:hypothetical protein
MATGNDDLWAGGLGVNGILTLPESYAEQSGLSAKIGWWRNVPGTVVINGQRLDGPAPPISTRGSEGYGRTGFQGSGVGFPTEGCWEITGSIGESELTFVMFVHVEA